MLILFVEKYLKIATLLLIVKIYFQKDIMQMNSRETSVVLIEFPILGIGRSTKLMRIQLYWTNSH